MEQFNAYVEENAERFIEELKEFCRQPSISTQNVGLEEMAELVRGRLERLGAEVRFIPVDDGPTVVFAELGQGERTLLIYNHYDVQPPDPLEEWESPPFEPTIREGKLYARGVIDKAGYGKQYGHGLGHGIGLEIHEAPRLSPSQETLLRPGMIVTVEPGSRARSVVVIRHLFGVSAIFLVVGLLAPILTVIAHEEIALLGRVVLHQRIQRIRLLRPPCETIDSLVLEAESDFQNTFSCEYLEQAVNVRRTTPA